VYASLRVSKDAKRIVQLVFDITRGRCSGGRQYRANVDLRLTDGAGIGVDGHATYAHVIRDSRFITATGRRIRGPERIALSSVFTGDSASGTVDVSFRTHRVRCSTGTIGFRAYREGSAGAPLHDYKFATGSYHGHLQDSSGRKQALSLELFLPWGLIELMRFRWELDCLTRTFNEQSTFETVPIREGEFQDFRVGGHGVIKLRHGIRAHWSYKLTGQGLGVAESSFWRGWRYLLGGSWGYDVQYTRAGQLLADCNQNATYIATGPPA